MSKEKKEQKKGMNITVIREGSDIGIETSFTQACLHYGWDYNKLIRGGSPKQVGKFKLIKLEAGLTIPCQRLRRFLAKSFTQTNTFLHEDEEGTHSADIVLGEDYQLEVSVTVTSEMQTTGTDRGDLDQRYYTSEITEILHVYDSEGDEVHLDNVTYDLLISKLEI